MACHRRAVRDLGVVGVIHLASRAGPLGVRSSAVAVAAGLALVASASCGGQAGGRHEGGGPVSPAVPRTSDAAARGAAVSALGRHGELAFVAHGSLFLLGGPAGAARRVDLPGMPFSLAWSADRRWLAVEVSQPPPAGSPYQQEPAALWLVNAAGTHTGRLTPASWDIISFAWSPQAPRLAAAVFLTGAKPGRSYAVATITPGGEHKVLAVGSYVSGVAWSPHRLRIAAGVSTFSRRSGWLGRLELVNPAGGGQPQVVAGSKGNVLEMAGWWPDGSGLLYWIDPQGSGSIAADGLPLDSVSLATRRSLQLVAGMLVHGSWLAFSRDGHTVAVVAGGDRVIWSGHKHIAICRPSSGCSAVAGPAGVVSLRPSWSPDGKTVVFTQASAAGAFGPSGHAGFSLHWIRRWQATSRMWLAAADGSSLRRLVAAGPGALDPVWGTDGSILFVRADWLWLLPAGASAPTRLAGPLGALAAPAYDRSYYGYIPYPQLIAWTGARPFAIASNS